MFAGSITMGQAAMKEKEVGLIELPRDMNFPKTGKHLTPRQSVVQVMIPSYEVSRRAKSWSFQLKADLAIVERGKGSEELGRAGFVVKKEEFILMHCNRSEVLHVCDVHKAF